MDERGNRGAEREMWRAREAALHTERERERERGRQECRNEGVKRGSDCFILLTTTENETLS